MRLEVNILVAWLFIAFAVRGPMPVMTKQIPTTSSSVRRVEGEKKRTAKGMIDACSLITKSEIAAVQGEAVKDAKTSTRVDGGLSMSHCLYSMTTFDKSVSLEVTQSNPDNHARYGPRDRWMELFHPATKKEEAKEEGEPNKPRPAPGIGDEAFWMGNRLVSVLYVLKKNAFLRISIGGPDKESVRLKKIMTLAQKALSRF